MKTYPFEATVCFVLSAKSGQNMKECQVVMHLAYYLKGKNPPQEECLHGKLI